MDVMSFTPTNGGAFRNLGQAAEVAYGGQAPVDEQVDAGLKVLQQFSGAMDLYPESARVAMNDYNRLLTAERTGNRLLAKALRYTHPEAAEAAKARTDTVWATTGGGGLYVQKPGATFDSLRALSWKIEVARALHNTIKRQVGRFSQPSEKDDQPGFRIRHTDPSHVMSQDQSDYCQWLTKFVTNSGRDFRPFMRRRDGRRTFRAFLQEGTDESLTHDNVAVELVALANGVGGLDSYYLRDGGTFYLAGPNKQGLYAYQSLVGLPELAFTHDQLAIYQRNVSPWVENRGYGRSELEASIDTLTNVLQALAYTREGMDNNAVPKGILTVYGQFDRRTMDMFQANWQAKLRGVRNRHNLPVLFSRNGQAAAQYTSTNSEFGEMAFAKWIGLQSSVFCGIYGADPKEINLDGFSSGSTSSLAGDDTAEKLAASKNKCLETHLADWEGFFSDEIIARFDDQFRLTFTGLDTMEAKAKRAREEKVSTINELRASLGMKNHPLGWFGELPADSNLLSAEFQRINTVGTLNEGRAAWGGFDKFPDEAVGAALLNPSLGSVYQSAIAPDEPDPTADGDPGAGGDPFGDAGGDPEDGDGQGQGDGGEDPQKPSDLHRETADNLRDLKG